MAAGLITVSTPYLTTSHLTLRFLMAAPVHTSLNYTLRLFRVQMQWELQCRDGDVSELEDIRVRVCPIKIELPINPAPFAFALHVFPRYDIQHRSRLFSALSKLQKFTQQTVLPFKKALLTRVMGTTFEPSVCASHESGSTRNRI